MATTVGAPSLVSECWCCGGTVDEASLLRLGNHPEVAICLPCVHSLEVRVTEIEDRTRTGIAVRGRAVIRRVRITVIDQGWHQSSVIGGPLRWLGRHLP